MQGPGFDPRPPPKKNSLNCSYNHAIFHIGSKWKLLLVLTIIMQFFKRINVLNKMRAQTEENVTKIISLVFPFFQLSCHTPSMSADVLEVEILVLWLKKDPYYTKEKINALSCEKKNNIIKKLASMLIHTHHYQY